MDDAATPDRVAVLEDEVDLEGKGEHEGGAVKTAVIVALPIDGGDETIVVEVMLFCGLTDNDVDTGIGSDDVDTGMGSDDVEGVDACVANVPVGVVGALCTEGEDGGNAPLVDTS